MGGDSEVSKAPRESSARAVVREGTFVGDDADSREALSLLAATLEATADGLLVVDEIGRIRMFNAQFARMWQIPDDVLAAKDDDKALSFVLDQLLDPDGFVAKVRELYATPSAESFDVLLFKDGRVFERYSKPQRVDDQIVGRVWSFRDVSERKRLGTSCTTKRSMIRSRGSPTRRCSSTASSTRWRASDGEQGNSRCSSWTSTTSRW
jgi:PAS domain-containing protein